MRCNHSQFLLISSLTFSVSMNSLIAPSVIAWFVRVKAFNALIRMRIGFVAQNSLDSFRHHTPTIIQVGIDCFLIQQQFTQTFQRTLIAITM